jgi:hypothetical protein
MRYHGPLASPWKRSGLLVPHPLLYRGLMVARILLCLLIPVGLPDTPRPLPQPPLDPSKRRRTRSEERKPFPGLSHKPRCAAWAQGAEGHAKAPGLPPPLRRFTRGRRRTGETHAPCCPAPACASHGWRGRGTIHAPGHPGGQRWRPCQGVSGDGFVQAPPGTPWPGQRVAPARLVWAVGALAEGLGSRAVARGWGGAPHTVRAWCVDVAEHAAAFARYCLHDVHVPQGQWDALFALLSAVQTGAGSAAEALQRLSRSPHWGWGAIDPVTPLRRPLDVGERTLAMAHRVGQQGVQGVAPGWVPLLLTEGCKEDTTALLTHDGPWGQAPRPRAQGPAPPPRWMPLPGLLYGPVVQTGRRRRLVRVRPRVVVGTLEALPQGLAACGWQSQTACGERLHLPSRQQVAAVGRRGRTRCQGEAGLRQPLVLSHGYETFCLPHASLRVALPQPLPTTGTGSAKPWRPRTPARAAGLTERGWPLQAGVLLRGPPWPPPIQA